MNGPPSDYLQTVRLLLGSSGSQLSSEIVDEYVPFFSQGLRCFDQVLIGTRRSRQSSPLYRSEIYHLNQQLGFQFQGPQFRARHYPMLVFWRCSVPPLPLPRLLQIHRPWLSCFLTDGDQNDQSQKLPFRERFRFFDGSSFQVLRSRLPSFHYCASSFWLRSPS